ncbi:MAG TPA: hypothetical protein VFC63_24330 [Blastocatellia bacterium]|nr:hypothetical protein [Blastocatellia bacterium]
MKTMRITRIIVLLSAIIGVFGIQAMAQSEDDKIKVDVTVHSDKTADERANDKLREREVLKAAEDRHKAEMAAAIAAKDTKALLAQTRTIYISSSTTYFKPVMLQNAFRKRSDFDLLQVAMIDAYGKQDLADAIIEIDRPLFTYYFTYKITDRSTGLLLGTGRVTAFDGSIAAGKLAEKIVQDIAKARKP